MSAVRRASTQLLTQRSVHVRIVPRPANVGESREVLRVLQRFGELTMYKSLRFEYHNPADNVALAIFREPNSATQAIQNSPLRFSISVAAKPGDEEARTEESVLDDDQMEPKMPSQDGVDELVRPSTLVNRATTAASTPNDFFSATHAPKNPLHHTTTKPPPMPFAPSPSNKLHYTYQKHFLVTIDRSRVIHQDFVERQPFWAQFGPMKSLAQEDLARKVPHLGLSDVSKRPPHAHRTPNKILNLMANYTANHMPSPAKLMEEVSKGDTARRDREP